MILLEAAAAAIVALYVASRWRSCPDRKLFLVRLATVALGAWATEESCIRWYGFYNYSAEWSLFLGRVPLMVVLIWPVVIDSARNLVTAGGRAMAAWREAFLLGLAVFTDAALIEPVSVRAGLWWWHEPGLFHVPPIGIFGWALYAGLVGYCSDRLAEKGTRRWRVLWGAPVAFAVTHLGLLAAWWGLLRWLNSPLDSGAGVLVAWSAATLASLQFLRRGTGLRMAPPTLLLRVPAALFFFVLVGLYQRGWSDPLVLYFAAFTPPYLVLTWQSLRRPKPPG